MELKICFVVHRYPPFAGGSEYYVQQMAEECVRRGIETTVVTESQQGELNGVKISCSPLDLAGHDLVVVHGGGPSVQTYVLSNPIITGSPILYMLIEPSDDERCILGMQNADYIGCSSLEDWEHVYRHGFEDKAHKVIHGISLTDNTGKRGVFRKKFNISKDITMFLSCGGYWPNKQMRELAAAFEEANIPNAVLVTTGYTNTIDAMPMAADNIIPLILDDPQDVKNAMADADCYVMNSSSEGFGLTILESMYNKTPWIARNIAGPRLLAQYGEVFETKPELIFLMQNFIRNDFKIDRAQNHVLHHHLISNTIDDILSIIFSSSREGEK